MKGCGLQMLKTIFMGTPEFAIPSLEIVDKNTDLKLIFTKEDKPNSRGNKIMNSPVKNYALENNISILQPSRMRDEEIISEIKKIIGLVPQEIALFPMLTGKENLRIIGGMYGVEGNILKERVDELLERFGLENSAERPLSQYSGGMKRRINLLAGLLHKPKILILDEPTVGVDAQSRNLILEELIKINREGTTVLFISHYLEEAECICDTVGLIDGGKIVLEGNPVELGKSNPECKNLEALYFKLTGKQMRDTYE